MNYGVFIQTWAHTLLSPNVWHPHLPIALCAFGRTQGKGRCLKVTLQTCAPTNPGPPTRGRETVSTMHRYREWGPPLAFWGNSVIFLTNQSKADVSNLFCNCLRQVVYGAVVYMNCTVYNSSPLLPVPKTKQRQKAVQVYKKFLYRVCVALWSDQNRSSFRVYWLLKVIHKNFNFHL